MSVDPLNSAPNRSSQITGCTSVIATYGLAHERPQVPSGHGRVCRSAGRHREPPFAVRRRGRRGAGRRRRARAARRSPRPRASPPPRARRARPARARAPSSGAGPQRAAVDGDLAMPATGSSARATRPVGVVVRARRGRRRRAARASARRASPSATTRPRSTIASRSASSVGLLEVVGGQQDRQPLLACEAPDLLPHVAARPPGRARWWARRGTAPAGGGRGRWPRRGGAACRPSRCAPAVGGRGETEALEQLVGARA